MNLFDTHDPYQDHSPTLRHALGQVDHATALVQLATTRGLASDGDAAELVLHFIDKCQQALENVATVAEHRCPMTYPELREMLDALTQTRVELERMRGAA